MLKYIIWVIVWSMICGYFLVGYTYKPISKQIDVKTMSLTKPDYILKKWSVCNWSCRNYSSSSSYWGGSFSWK